MNTILKISQRMSSLRLLSGSAKSLSNVSSKNVRNIWFRSNSRLLTNGCSSSKLIQPGEPCSCGCNWGSKRVHTKAEEELADFLKEEIPAEQNVQKFKTIPTEIDGFQAGLNGSEVSLTKTLENNTKITVYFNINHSIDMDTEPPEELNPDSQRQQLGEFVSKPNFKVELVHNKTTFTIVCSFNEPDQEEIEQGYSDVFSIDELSIYETGNCDKAYAISSSVIDGCLHDLLMNYLEEKGVTNDFVKKLSQFSTAYEHSAYVGLLEGMYRFVLRK